MESLVTTLLELIVKWGSIAAVICIPAYLIVRYTTPFLLRKWTIWRERSTREHHEIKSQLLAHDGLVEKYAPSTRYVRDANEGERGGKQRAWLSPYPRAVKASLKRYGRVGSGVKFDARRQIADAAKRISISEDRASVERGDNPKEHFRIDLKLDGHDPAEFTKMQGQLIAQLGLHSIAPFDSEDAYTVSFIGHKTAPTDILATSKIGREFLEENTPKSTKSIPIAKTDTGQVWSLPMHHTLANGSTGSGKGSFINNVIYQLHGYHNQGLVRLFGVDPKMSELRPWEQSTLFDRIVYENEDALHLIAQVYELMKKRQREKKVDVDGGDLGRDFVPTVKNPFIILLIDEMLSMLIAFKGLGRDGQSAVTLLTAVLAQGRSEGVIVMGATQEMDKELLGRMRGNFGNVILLRQGSPPLHQRPLPRRKRRS